MISNPYLDLELEKQKEMERLQTLLAAAKQEEDAFQRDRALASGLAGAADALSNVGSFGSIMLGLEQPRSNIKGAIESSFGEAPTEAARLQKLIDASKGDVQGLKLKGVERGLEVEDEKSKRQYEAQKTASDRAFQLNLSDRKMMQDLLKEESNQKKERAKFGISGFDLQEGVSPTDTIRTKVQAGLDSAAKLEILANEYMKYLNEYGIESAPTNARAQMEKLEKEMMLEKKNVDELGALAGPDVAILEPTVPNATGYGLKAKQAFGVTPFGFAAKLAGISDDPALIAKETAKSMVDLAKKKAFAGAKSAGYMPQQGIEMSSASPMKKLIKVKQNGIEYTIDPETGEAVE